MKFLFENPKNRTFEKGLKDFCSPLINIPYKNKEACANRILEPLSL